MLADIRSVADAKGFADVFISVVNKGDRFGVKQEGYHELFVGSGMKSLGFKIGEFGLSVGRRFTSEYTEIDVVATRVNRDIVESCVLERLKKVAHPVGT